MSTQLHLLTQRPTSELQFIREVDRLSTAFSTQQCNKTSFKNDTMFQWNVTLFHSAQRYTRFPVTNKSTHFSLGSKSPHTHQPQLFHPTRELSLKKEKMLPVASIPRAMATQRNSQCHGRFEVPEKCCTSVEHPLQSQVLGK